MSDAMDPFVWTEPAPLPDPTLVDFFTSSLPESPQPLQVSPDTPSNSTHPWESELATLQQQNATLQEGLADVPRLLEQLDRQKAELTAARRRLVAVESDRAKLLDRIDRLERTAKRPRVENLCSNCGRRRDRASGISDWLGRVAHVEVQDFAPEVRSFVTILEDEKRDHSSEKAPKAVYACLLRADEERCRRILRRIAAAAMLQNPTVSALVDGILNETKRTLQQTDSNAASMKSVVRILLQGAAAGVWTKRTAAEVLACFIAMRREAGDLLRVVLSSNESRVKEVLIENTDGRDLNLLWGPSLQAVLTFFITSAAVAELSAGLSTHEAFLSRWNNVRTTVEDLRDHASLCDAEKALLLEWSMSTAEICFEVAVRRALLEKVSDMTTQTEKMEKMLALIASLMTVLRREETDGVQQCTRTVAKWLVCLSCMDDLAPRLAVTAANMAVELLSGYGREEEEHKKLMTELVRFSRRQIGEEDRKLMSEKLVRLLRREGLMK